MRKQSPVMSHGPKTAGEVKNATPNLVGDLGIRTLLEESKRATANAVLATALATASLSSRPSTVTGSPRTPAHPSPTSASAGVLSSLSPNKASGTGNGNGDHHRRDGGAGERVLIPSTWTQSAQDSSNVEKKTEYHHSYLQGCLFSAFLSLLLFHFSCWLFVL